MNLSKIRVLVITAVPAERDAVIRGLQNDPRFDVVAGGVGLAAAATATAKLLATNGYDLVINAGIGGGFPDRAQVGTLVVAEEIVAADLGVETHEGFICLEELGLGFTRIKADMVLVARLTEALKTNGFTVNTGSVLTVSTVTGTAERAEELARRVPRALAEVMEGFGVAYAAGDHSLPVLAIYAISNEVGLRDRASWRVKEALELLEKASYRLAEVLK